MFSQFSFIPSEIILNESISLIEGMSFGREIGTSPLLQERRCFLPRNEGMYPTLVRRDVSYLEMKGCLLPLMKGCLLPWDERMFPTFFLKERMSSTLEDIQRQETFKGSRHLKVGDIKRQETSIRQETSNGRRHLKVGTI